MNMYSQDLQNINTVSCLGKIEDFSSNHENLILKYIGSPTRARFAIHMDAGVVEQFSRWKEWAETDGVKLEVRVNRLL